MVFTFVLIHLAPGDPIAIFAGESGDAAYYAEMRARFGLDRPLHEQLLVYIGNVARGEFGTSYFHRRPALEIIADRIPATLLLMLTALVLSTIAGIWLGATAARHSDRAPDHAITVGTLVGGATPAFWLGQVLVIVFAANLGWFPVQGMTSVRGVPEGFARVLDLLHHLVLPALTLGLLQLALVTRLTRAGVREALADEYVRTARAKGLAPGAVLGRHALPNALLPVVTVVGGHFGTLLTGAVLTEIIFAWPGLGRLLYDATLSRDYPLLMSIFLVASVSVIVANLLTDLAYGALDPRVRLR
ncbi:MAG: ABC transporter permease [Chloroflexota bacterium]|nr:ABC transporter permease [Chloroflexota bacterium]